MKLPIRILLTLLMPLFTLSAYADKNVKYFESLSTSNAYNY